MKLAGWSLSVVITAVLGVAWAAPMRVAAQGVDDEATPVRWRLAALAAERGPVIRGAYVKAQVYAAIEPGWHTGMRRCITFASIRRTS